MNSSSKSNGNQEESSLPSDADDRKEAGALAANAETFFLAGDLIGDGQINIYHRKIDTPLALMISEYLIEKIISLTPKIGSPSQLVAKDQLIIAHKIIKSLREANMEVIDGSKGAEA